MQTEELLKAWDLLSEGREVRYFAKRSDGSALGGRLYSPEALVRGARNLDELGYDVYLHLNPSTGRGLKATSRQVTALRHILIDLDPVSPELAATTAMNAVLDVADNIHSGTLFAANVLDTGRGAQAWVDMGNFRPIDSVGRIERATSRFLQALRREWDGRYGYRIDAVCYDLGRIARCPGTRNTKTGTMAKLISRAHHPLEPGTFLHAFYTEPPRVAVERPKNISNLMATAPHLNWLSREFLHNGVEEGDRHHAAYAAARSLIELGMDGGSVRYWVLRGASRCRPRLYESEALHCIRMAAKREEHD